LTDYKFQAWSAVIAAAALRLSLQQPHSPITVGNKHKKLQLLL